MPISERDFQVLEAVIRAHVLTGEPISSFAVAQSLDNDYSSATIRNAFVRLSEEGYLMQPHTSAGRVPTRAAYEAYVASLEQVYDARLQTLKHALLAAERLQNDLHLLTGIYDGHIQHLHGFSALLQDSEQFDESCARALGKLIDTVIASPDEFLGLPRGHGMRIVVHGEDASGATLLVARAGPERTLFAAGPMRMDYEHALNLMSHEY